MRKYAEYSVNYRYYGTGWFLSGRIFIGKRKRGNIPVLSKKETLLPNIVKSHSSILIRKLNGVDLINIINQTEQIYKLCNVIYK